MTRAIVSASLLVTSLVFRWCGTLDASPHFTWSILRLQPRFHSVRHSAQSWRSQTRWRPLAARRARRRLNAHYPVTGWELVSKLAKHGVVASAPMSRTHVSGLWCCLPPVCDRVLDVVGHRFMTRVPGSCLAQLDCTSYCVFITWAQQADISKASATCAVALAGRLRRTCSSPVAQSSPFANSGPGLVPADSSGATTCSGTRACSSDMCLVGTACCRQLPLGPFRAMTAVLCGPSRPSLRSGLCVACSTSREMCF